MSGSRVARVLGAGVLALGALIAFTPLAPVLHRHAVIAPDLGDADAIVVLGAGADPEGRLGDASLRRTLHGITLFRQGLAPVLLLCGPQAEAGSRGRLAAALGVPPSAILEDAASQTTREEAASAGRTLPPRGVRRVLLVTGAHHEPRALALFRAQGFVVRAAPVDELGAGTDRTEQQIAVVRGVIQEMVARVYYRLAGYL